MGEGGAKGRGGGGGQGRPGAEEEGGPNVLHGSKSGAKMRCLSRSPTPQVSEADGSKGDEAEGRSEGRSGAEGRR